jgi:hypothetical protein
MRNHPIRSPRSASTSARTLSTSSGSISAAPHDVRLIPAQYVKPFLKGHKNDYRDAEAVQRPTMNFVRD